MSNDMTVFLSDTLKGEPKDSFHGPAAGEVITCLAFSPDDKTIAWGTNAMSVQMFSLATRKYRVTVRGGVWPVQVHALAYSPDGKSLAAGYAKAAIRYGTQTLKLWDARTGKQTVSFYERHKDTVHCVLFSPDGTKLASASADKTIKIWDAKSGKNIATLNGHASAVKLLAFSSDGKTLVSGATDGAVKSWNMQTYKNGISYNCDGFLYAFSADGKTLFSWERGSGAFKLWDAPTGKNTLTLKGIWPFLAHSPDGRTLATHAEAWAINVWDLPAAEKAGK